MNKLESVVADIQQFANLCIRREYELRAYSFSAKREHLNEMQRQVVVDEELLKTSDELMLIIRRIPILQSLSDYIDNPNFLWDSTFIEVLSADEKKKYAKFNLSSVDIAVYTDNSQTYDAELPHFSSVVEYATLVRYVNYLKKYTCTEIIPEPLTPEDTELKVEVVEQPRHFEADFNVDLFKTFRVVKNHIKDKGLFLLDCFNSNIQYIVEGEKEQKEITTYTTNDGRKILIRQTMRYENKTQINRIEWHYFIDGEFNSIQNLDMRMFFPQELDAYLEWNGFDILHKYGGFEEKAFNDNSEKQVFVCKC